MRIDTSIGGTIVETAEKDKLIESLTHSNETYQSAIAKLKLNIFELEKSKATYEAEIERLTSQNEKLQRSNREYQTLTEELDLRLQKLRRSLYRVIEA